MSILRRFPTELWRAPLGIAAALGVWMISSPMFAQAPAPAPVAPVPPVPASDPGTDPNRAPVQPAPVAGVGPPPQPARKPPGNPLRDPQIEIESKFFEIPEAVAEKLGLLTPAQAPASNAAAAAKGSPKASSGDLGVQTIMDPAAVTQFLQRLKGEKGVNLLSAPRLTTRSGMRAVIEIIREYRYPTEFNFEKDAGIQIPTAFETRNLGVTLEVDPVASGDAIDLQLVPQVVELEGFVRAKDGQTVPLVGGRSVGANLTIKDVGGIKFSGDSVLQPIFSCRKVTANVALSSGQSVLLGGMKREDQADGKPLTSRILYVLVTARTMDRPVAHGAPLDVLPVAVINPADEPGFVRSPYAPEGKAIDARGLPPGAELKCPVTRNLFRLR